ncbi:MFS transporter [Sphingomonas solaris]|nr:MFS transporter [Sphingomonas solaris]
MTTTSAPAAGNRYAWYTLFVLIVAYTLSFIDRQILTLLVGPIRASLRISDFELSLLHGIAFALFYTVLGIPIGRLVDRRRRTTIVAIGIAVWSLMTATCGLTRSFGQLFLARIGVGVGEAALSPGAYSMLSDIFPARELPRAINIYTGAAYIGAGVATILGGTIITLMPPLDLPVVGRLEPWQAVFVSLGLPGLLVALWVLSLREPTRTGLHTGLHGATGNAQPSLRAVLRYIGDRRSAYGLLILGYSVAGIMWNGSMAWLPTFFIRVHGWSIAEAGLRYGLAVMIGGGFGVFFGGWLTVRLRTRGYLDSNIRIGLITLATAAPTGIAAMLVPSAGVALVLVTLFLFACSMPWGGAAAALQEITPNQMRGQVSAVYLFCLSLLGLGLGPAVVAGFTDRLFGDDAALPWSLALTILITAPVAALLLWRARKPYCAVLAAPAF